MTEPQIDKSSLRTIFVKGIKVEPELIIWFAQHSRTQGDLARKLNITRIALDAVLNRAGFDKDDVVAMFIGGTVEERRAQHQQRILDRQDARARDWQRVVDLYVNDMMSIDEVAEATNRSAGGVWRILNRHGVDTTRYAITDTPAERRDVIRDELTQLILSHLGDTPDATTHAETLTKQIMTTYRVTRVRQQAPRRQPQPPAASTEPPSGTEAGAEAQAAELPL